MRIGVIGGGGHFGRRVVSALEECHDVDVVVASRRSATLPLDLTKPETFEHLVGFDAIINCADSVGAPSDALMRFVLERGLTLFDMGADDDMTARQMKIQVSDPQGHVVLGVGLFPGLSTCLAFETAQDENVERLDLGIRLSPLSGSGDANVDLMTGVLSRRQPGGFLEIPFYGCGRQSGVGMTLPDAWLLRSMMKSDKVHTWMAFSPSIMRFNFALLAWFVPRLGPIKGVALWFLRWQLWLLRAVLLKNRKTSIEITASLNRGDKIRKVHVTDGQGAVGSATASMALRWLRKTPDLPPGLHLAGSLFSVDEIVSCMKNLDGDDTIFIE